MKKISVLGLGYVGYPLLLAIANKTDYEVVGFDPNEKAVKAINEGKSPVVDDTLDDDVKVSVPLKASTDTKILEDSDVFIVCVPTPVTKDYEPDYSYVISASQTCAKYLKKGGIIVVESTVNPGTCEEVIEPAIAEIADLKMGKDYDIVHAPERINPGDASNNVYSLPRNVGGSRVEAAEKIKEIYDHFISADVKVVSNLKVAEASKIIENSFRDLNIAFVNELAKSFDAMGIDLIETIEAASSKFSFMPHWPGPGVGGHCIAVDPYYLIKRAAKSGFNHRLLKEARNINNSMPEYTIHKLSLLLNKIEKPIKNSKIVLLGLSYKPGVGDMRESPSIVVKKLLEDLEANIVIFDPYLPGFSTAKDLDEAVKDADAVLHLTAHEEFINKLKPSYLKEMDVKTVLDARNKLDKDGIMEAGIPFTGIGK